MFSRHHVSKCDDCEKFQYENLNRNPPEIRVLELHPALRSSAPLHCTLRHEKLEQAEYSALSYVWGQQSHDTSVVKVEYETTAGGSAPGVQFFRFGSSLARALRCLRRNSKRVTVWADAICINQNEGEAATEERSWQVETMRLVYLRATEVHAWLGPCYHCPGGESKVVEGIEAAFKTAKAIWDIAQNRPFSNSPTCEEEWHQVCLTLAHIDVTNSQQLPWSAQCWSGFARELRDAAIAESPIRSKLTALSLLSQTQYFARVWILQEVGRARALTFHYGRHHMSHIPLLLALSMGHSLLHSKKPSKFQVAMRGFDPRFLRCLEARTTWRMRCSVAEVLALAYLSPPPMQEAGKPRDLIYARLGLASDQAVDRKGIKVDYELSTSEVFASATRFLFSEGFMDPLIAFKPYRPKYATPADKLPSWGCDWTQYDLKIFSTYNASNDTKAQVSFVPYPGASLGQAMTLTGVDVGIVKDRGEKFHTLVKAAGLSNRTLYTGSLKTESLVLSAREKEELTANIGNLHRQLDTSASEADINKLFSHRSLPLPKFWCWWLLWMLEIKKLFSDPQSQEHDNITDLLFREASLSPADAKRPTSLEALADLRLWLGLIFTDSGGESATTELGTDLVETVFRSAWGMRPALLDAGHLCYVPELSRDGDHVVIFHGVNAPLVLEQQTDGKAHRLIGPAHVRGVMQGELKMSHLSTRTYTLI